VVCTQRLGNSGLHLGKDGFYIKASANEFQAVSLWNERRGKETMPGKIAPAAYEAVPERLERAPKPGSACLASCTLPDLLQEAGAKLSGAGQTRFIADGKLDSLSGIDALKAYGWESHIAKYKVLAFRVASSMQIVNGDDGFWKGLIGRLREEGLFAEQILLDGHPGKNEAMIALFAYDVGKLIGINVQLAFCGDSVYAGKGDFLLKGRTVAMVGSTEMGKLDFAKDFSDVRYEIYTAAGFRAMDDGDFPLALSCLLETVEIKPCDPDAYRMVGSLLSSMGRQSDAVPYMRKAIEVSRDDHERSSNYVELAFIRSGSSDIKDVRMAIADCTEAIRLDPGNAAAYGTRGDLYFMADEFDLGNADRKKFRGMTGCG
jgi:hypothetical protein